MINNYPDGACFDKTAPYNQEYIEVEGVITLTVTKTFKVPSDIHDINAIKEEILKQFSIPEGYELEHIDV